MPPKLTQPLRPVQRYRKGQLPQGVQPSTSDDEDSDQEQQPPQDEQQHSDEDDQVQEFTSVKQTGGAKIGVKLGQVKVDQQGKVIRPGEEESSEYGKASTLFASFHD